MSQVPLKSIESFTYVNDSNTKGQKVKVIGYQTGIPFTYVVLLNNELVLTKEYKHKSDTTPFNLIREVLYPDTHQKVLDIIKTLKEDLFKHSVSLKWDEYEFCTVDTYLCLKGEIQDYYWNLLRKAEDAIEKESGLDWYFESLGYNELWPNWNNKPYD